jgi:hypothetical protein
LVPVCGSEWQVSGDEIGEAAVSSESLAGLRPHELGARKLPANVANSRCDFQGGSDIALLKREAEFAISTTAGKKAVSVRTLAGWAHDVVGDTIEGFQVKRIRSGVETLLAANGVSREIRGHLQSHGLTGVQARHYDGHDYMPEKRQAIEILVREVCQSAPAVA